MQHVLEREASEPGRGAPQEGELAGSSHVNPFQSTVTEALGFPPAGVRVRSTVMVPQCG